MKNIRPLKQKMQKKIQLNKKQFKRLYENSIEMDELLLQLFVLGKTYIEQHQMLHHLAENHPIFLWERIKFLISCFQPDTTFLQISHKPSRPTMKLLENVESIRVRKTRKNEEKQKKPV